MSYRGRGRGGYQNNTYNRNGNDPLAEANQFVQANSVPVDILGWNGATFDDCIKFISRKCRITVANASVDPASGVLRGYVRLTKEADELCAWLGVKFAGQLLRITKGHASGVGGATAGGGGAPTTIETITAFLRRRYDPQAKLLNISAVSLDPQLAAQGFFALLLTTSKFFPALMKIGADLKLDVQSVDLLLNNLTDLAPVLTLAQLFPRLQNLALLHNLLARIKAFDVWRNKLNYVRELVLLDNPITTAVALPHDAAVVQLEIMKIFPRLVVLNGEVVRDEGKLQQHLTLPFASPVPIFVENDAIQQVLTAFVANYLKLWDEGRAGLMGLYQPESQFLLQVDSLHPHTLDAAPAAPSTLHGRYGDPLPFAYYLLQSRNLTKVSTAKLRMAKLATGPEQIYKQFETLPQTRHHLVTLPHLYSMESYSYPQLGGILVTLHGSFEETAPPQVDTSNNTNTTSRGRNSGSRNARKPPLGRKLFDRTFVIVPANGSMIVASDMLLVRLYAEPDAWAPAETPTPAAAAAAAPAAPDLPPDVRANLTDVQQQLLLRVLFETKLNLQYSLMLCEQSQWDYQNCIANFKNSAASLPRDAYQ